MRDVDVERALESRNWLGECLLVDVRWRYHGLVVELEFNDVWNEDRSAVRADALSNVDPFVLVASGVFEIHAKHQITAGLLRSMDLADWGLDEVAMVRVNDGVALPFGGDQVATRVVHVQWESGRDLVVSAAWLSARSGR